MAFVLGEFIAVQNWIWIFLIIFILMATIKIITKQQVTVFVVFFLFCIIGFLITEYEIKTRDVAYSLEEKQATVAGQISKLEETQFGYQIYLQNIILNNQKFNTIIVYTDNIDGLKIGNKVRVKGYIQQFSIARNQGNYDSKNYYMSLGIYVGISAIKVEKINSDYDVVRENLRQLKESIDRHLDRVCNYKTKGLFKILQDKNTVYEGILLGDKSDMNKELKEIYSVAGISHVLAISGLHISIIGMFIYTLLRKRFSFGIATSFSVTAVVAFGILSGMGIAAIRAIIMFGLKLLGEVLGRNYDYLTSISLAGMILLLNNPFIIYNAGFQMSFAAIFSIVIVWEKVSYILQLDKNKKIKNNILFSITITIFMHPIVAYHYYALPTYSFVLNMLIVPMMSVVVVSGVMGSGFSYLGIGIARLMILPGCLVLEFYEKLCNLVLRFPFANVIVGRPNLWIVYLFYAIIMLFLLTLEKIRKDYLQEKETSITEISQCGISIKKYIANKNNRKKEKVFVLSLFIIAIVSDAMLYFYIPIKNTFIERNELKVNVLDVGQGDGIIIQTPNHKVITIDGGSTSVENVGKNRLIPYMKYQGIKKIEYAIMTHGDIDHISGLMELMEQSDRNGVKVKNLILPIIQQKDKTYCQMEEMAREHSINVLYIKENDYIKLNEVELKCLHPNEDTATDNRNDSSTVLWLSYDNFSMIFTGDISAKQEEMIKDKITQCTVLKVAHHGSKYSSCNDFLQRVNPVYSVISVGKNNLYGHPSQETFERLKQIGSNIFRTDECGQVTISTDGERMSVDEIVKK